jgi:hypothetical protein
MADVVTAPALRKAWDGLLTRTGQTEDTVRAVNLARIFDASEMIL